VVAIWFRCFRGREPPDLDEGASHALSEISAPGVVTLIRSGGRGSLLYGADLSAPRLIAGSRAPEKEMPEVC
jgi:hypothetical protein